MASEPAFFASILLLEAPEFTHPAVLLLGDSALIFSIPTCSSSTYDRSVWFEILYCQKAFGVVRSEDRPTANHNDIRERITDLLTIL